MLFCAVIDNLLALGKMYAQLNTPASDV
jgi:hypothetical protein